MPSSGGKSKKSDRAKVLLYLSKLPDREVMEALQEVRRRKFSSASGSIRSTWSSLKKTFSGSIDGDALSYKAEIRNVDSSVKQSFSGSADEEEQSYNGSIEKNSPYKVEIQEFHGSDDSVNNTTVLSHGSFEERSENSRQSSKKYGYAYDASLEQIVLEEISKTHYQIESEEEISYTKQNRARNRKFSSPHRSSHNSGTYLKNLTLSIDSGDSESLTDHIDYSSEIQARISGFCTNGFGCFGSSQKYSDMNRSPLTKKVSRSKFIDGFRLHNVRSKGSSLMDEGNRMDNDDDDEEDNKFSGRRGINTPVAAGCSAGFEQIMERLAGIYDDDDDDTLMDLPQIESINRIKQNKSEATMSTGLTVESTETMDDNTRISADNYTTETDGEDISYWSSQDKGYDRSMKRIDSQAHSKANVENFTNLSARDYMVSSSDDYTISTAGDNTVGKHADYNMKSFNGDNNKDVSKHSIRPPENNNMMTYLANASAFNKDELMRRDESYSTSSNATYSLTTLENKTSPSVVNSISSQGKYGKMITRHSYRKKYAATMSTADSTDEETAHEFSSGINKPASVCSSSYQSSGTSHRILTLFEA